MVPILILLNLLQRYISISIKFIQIDLYLTILTIAMCLLDFSESIQYIYIFRNSNKCLSEHIAQFISNNWSDKFFNLKWIKRKA